MAGFEACIWQPRGYSRPHGMRSMPTVIQDRSMSKNRTPAFVVYGIQPRKRGMQEPQFQYDLSRGLLPEIVRICLPDSSSEQKNAAIFKLATTFRDIIDGATENVEGRSFSVTDINEEYVKLTINASLLRPLGIDLKASPNKAVASFGLRCLSDYDSWQGAKTARD